MHDVINAHLFLTCVLYVSNIYKKDTNSPRKFHVLEVNTILRFLSIPFWLSRR